MGEGISALCWGAGVVGCWNVSISVVGGLGAEFVRE